MTGGERDAAKALSRTLLIYTSTLISQWPQRHTQAPTRLKYPPAWAHVPAASGLSRIQQNIPAHADVAKTCQGRVRDGARPDANEAVLSKGACRDQQN